MLGKVFLLFGFSMQGFSGRTKMNVRKNFRMCRQSYTLDVACGEVWAIWLELEIVACWRFSLANLLFLGARNPLTSWAVMKVLWNTKGWLCKTMDTLWAYGGQTKWRRNEKRWKYDEHIMESVKVQRNHVAMKMRWKTMSTIWNTVMIRENNLNYCWIWLGANYDEHPEFRNAQSHAGILCAYC